MPRAVWPLRHDQPTIQIVLSWPTGSQTVVRHLLADTGAGSARSGFEMVLDEQDCTGAGGIPSQPVTLGGAYIGSFPVYALRVRIPALQFDQHVRAVGVPVVPTGLDGLAGFRFLNRFTYGNFGDPGQFGLEA